MSLTTQQTQNTIDELRQNFELTGLSTHQVAADLNISEPKLGRIMSLTQASLNDPWILRNYLLDKVQERGLEPVAFTALEGDWHDYWFLDTRAIDAREMSGGDR